MEFFQWERNPWGQETLIRISWDLLWAAAIGGALFIVVHLVMRKLWFPKHGHDAGATEEPAAKAAGIPERVPRHSMASRLFHWVMAASMLTLLITGFFPVIGIQFPWVTIHWISGIVLVLAIVYHMVHATFWLDLKSVAVGRADLRDAVRRLKRSLGRPGPAPKRHPKYPLENKLYHHLVSVAALVAMGTGLLMMVRVETPFWTRDPYLLAEGTWGIVYVLHGLSSVGLVGLVMSHVYFAVLPEKRWITRSMILGWIPRKEYQEHHDPERWVVVQENPTAEK